MPTVKTPPAEADALAVADLVQDVHGALAHLRRAEGFGRITIDLTVRNGVITVWEIAPHISRKPEYARKH